MGFESIAKLVGSYEHDDAAQFVLVIERLEDVLAALATERLSQTTGALILLDHLAETLLSRHVDARLAVGEAMKTGAHAFSTSERRRLRRSFPAKLDLAAGVGRFEGLVSPIVSADDHAVMTLAHAHRNDVHHRDRHKEGVLPILVCLLLDVVTRLWPKVTPNWTYSGLSGGPLVDTLARYGVEPADMDLSRAAVNLPDAARIVASEMTDGLELPVDQVGSSFACDLLERTEVISGTVAELVEQGMERDRIAFIFANSEFWNLHAGDPKLIETSQRASRWKRRGVAGHGRFSPDDEDDMARANHERNQRIVELRKTFVPRATIRTVGEVYDFAEGVAEMSSLSVLLPAYRRLDENLDALEAVLPDAVRAWDRIVEDAVDDAREAARE